MTKPNHFHFLAAKRLLAGLISVTLIFSPTIGYGKTFDHRSWDAEDMRELKTKLSVLPVTMCPNLNVLYDLVKASGELPIDEALELVVGEDAGCRIAARNEIANFVFEFRGDNEFATQVDLYYSKVEWIIDFEKDIIDQQKKIKSILDSNKGFAGRAIHTKLQPKYDQLSVKINYLNELALFLQDRWVFLNSEYMLKQDTDEPEWDFAENMAIGAGTLLTAYTVYSIVRGRKLQNTRMKLNHYAKKLSFKSIKAWGRMFWRTSGRTAFRSGLRTSAGNLVKVGGPKIVRASIVAGRQAARATLITAANEIKNPEGVAKSSDPDIRLNKHSLLVIKSENDYYHSPFQLYALDDIEVDKTNENIDVRALLSYTDYQDSKFLSGMLASIGGGLIAASTAEHLAAKYGLEKLFNKPGNWLIRTGQSISSRATATAVAATATTALIKMGIKANIFFGSAMVSVGKWLLSAGQLISKIGSRFGVAGFVAGMTVGVLLDTFVQDWIESETLEDIEQQVKTYYELARQPENTPYQTKMYLSRLTSALVQWSGFWSYPLIGSQEALSRAFIKERVCNTYRVPLSNKVYEWHQMRFLETPLTYRNPNLQPWPANVTVAKNQMINEGYEAALEELVKVSSVDARKAISGIDEILVDIEDIDANTLYEELEQIDMFKNSILVALNPKQLSQDAKKVAKTLSAELMVARRSGEIDQHQKFLGHGFKCLHTPYQKYDFHKKRDKFDEMINDHLAKRDADRAKVRAN